ncbi:MAG: methyl-accepting chemotaxis protein [Bryobacterales bacterium]|nr:methyl-accepting chemotaxis protein [Bryobacterales bacterium]
MFRNVKIWQKLVLAGALAVIPVLMLAALFLQSRNEQITRTQTELDGLDYVAPMRQLLERLPQHRSAASAYLNGAESVGPMMMSIQSQVDGAVSVLTEIEQKKGNALGTLQSWESIRLRWQDLKQRVSSLSADESNRRHTQLLADVLSHLRTVGDKTGLSAEPDLEAFYLSDSILNQIPWTTEYLGQLATYGSGVAARRTMTAQEEAQIRFLVRQVSSSIEVMDRNFQSAFRYNSDLRKGLEGGVSKAISSAGFLRNLTQREILDSAAITVLPRTYLENGSAAVTQLFNLHDQATAEIRAHLQSRIERLVEQKWTQLGWALGLLLLSGVLVFVIQKGIAEQIRSMSETFRQVSKGHYDARAEIYGKDELGMMAETTNAMLANTLTLIQSREERDRIQDSIRKLLDDVSGVAEGDLTKEAEVTAEMTGAIADSINYMMAELRTIIGAVQSTTANVNSSAQRVQDVTEVLADSSQHQSEQVRAASQILHMMAQSIRDVAERANDAATVADSALSGALAGGAAVRRTVEGMNSIRQHVQETSRRMKRLGESSQEIGEIVQLISDISDRTSILALNASIQAAMAGESGKGFAVVAEEVERLAERATEATNRITVLIKSVQTETYEAISAMEETTREVVDGSHVAGEAGDRLAQIEDVSRQITGLVKEISTTASEQASSSDRVAATVADVSDGTQSTAQEALRTATDIRQLATMVTELSHSLSRFRLPPTDADRPIPVTVVGS